jgi:hypothetical protein
MNMNIPGFSASKLQTFHAMIADCLTNDDAQTTDIGKFGVRTHPAWKQLGVDIETELSRRKIPFTPIKW